MTDATAASVGVLIGLIFGGVVGIPLALSTILLWNERVGCWLRGHSYDTRYYGPTFCSRAARNVINGRHKKS